METGLLLMLACATGFLGCFAVGRLLATLFWRQLEAAAVQLASSGADSGRVDARLKARAFCLYVLRNGVPPFGRIAGAMQAHDAFRLKCEEAASLLRRRGFRTSPRSLASLFVAGLVLVGLACSAASRSLIAGCLVLPFLVLLASALLSHGIDREREALREQVPDALRCMEACLHAGLSLPQAFSEVAAEVSSPAKEQFAQVAHDLELGYSMEEALTRFRKASVLPELGFVAMALDIQYACGGSATPILRSAEDSVASGLELRRLLRVQTAQARLSAQVVSIIPFFLLAVISVASPGFLAPFFADMQGIALFGSAIAMQLAGVVLVRRTLSVDF